MTMYNRELVLLVVVVITIVIILIVLNSRRSKQSDVLVIYSCRCRELATWHMGQIEHKLKCPVFRRLNPSLTVKQFYRKEGFDVQKDSPWPDTSL